MLPLVILSLVLLPGESGVVGAPGGVGAEARPALLRGAWAHGAHEALARAAFVGQLPPLMPCGRDPENTLCDIRAPSRFPAAPCARAGGRRAQLHDARVDGGRRGRTWGFRTDACGRSPRSFGIGTLCALGTAQSGDDGPQKGERRARNGPAREGGHGTPGLQGGPPLTTTRAYNGVLQRLARQGDMRASSKVLHPNRSAPRHCVAHSHTHAHAHAHRCSRRWTRRT